MPSPHKEIGTRVTPAQLAAITEAARRADCSLADLLRWGASIACAAQGIQFPDDMPAHGGPRQPTSEDCPASGAPA